MTTQHYDQAQLSRRWRMSPRTLEKWRTVKKGPAWIKVGGKVLYALSHIEAFERANLHLPRDAAVEFPEGDTSF